MVPTLCDRGGYEIRLLSTDDAGARRCERNETLVGDAPSATLAFAVLPRLVAGDGVVEVAEVRARGTQQPGDLLAFESDGVALGVVLVVGSNRLGGRHDVVEVVGEGFNLLDGAGSFEPQAAK